MPKKKKLVPNSGKSIAEIMKDNEATNSDGQISQAFTKNYDYFEDINCIYSEEYPEGKMLELLHIVLYCRFQRFQSNGKKCYESQGKLGQICKCDPGTIGDKIEELVKMGLVRKDPHPVMKGGTLIYTALEITDAHVIPPDQLPAAPIIVSDVVPDQPAPVKTVETHEDTPAITPQRIRTSDAVKHLFENLSQRREDESFYSWSSRVLQRIGIDHSMGIEQLFQETHSYEYTQIEQSTIPF